MKKTILRDKPHFPSIKALVEYASVQYAERTAYSFKDPLIKKTVKTSFAKLGEDIRDLAGMLIEKKYQYKPVAIIGRLSYYWAVSYFAALSVNVVLVPLDREWNQEELCHTVGTAGCAAVICDSDIKQKGEFISSQLSVPLITTDGSEPMSIPSLIAEGGLKFSGMSEAYYDHEPDVDRMSLLVFTSGTTGKGKGVMLSQKGILRDLECVVPYIDFGEKTLGVLPPHHTYGSSVTFVGHMMVGAEVYISSGLKYITRELIEQKPEHLVLVPLYLETFYRRIRSKIKDGNKEELFEKMLKFSKASKKLGIDLRKTLFNSVRVAFGGKIKTIVCGGAPINEEMLEFFEAIGIRVLNGYGITECSPIVSVNRSRDPRKNSVGHVLEVNDVRISDPNADGEGEILVKGDNVMLGYLNDEEATLQAFDRDGYFKTGDYGRLDSDGVLYITGRKKNLIILPNGKNVYPEEIETALCAIPGILEVVVYEGISKRGVAHNAITAEIFPDRDYCTTNGIEDFQSYLRPFINEYNKTAPSYKKITVIKIRKEEFYKNTLRKIIRFKIDTSID